MDNSQYKTVVCERGQTNEISPMITFTFYTEVPSVLLNSLEKQRQKIEFGKAEAAEFEGQSTKEEEEAKQKRQKTQKSA